MRARAVVIDFWSNIPAVPGQSDMPFFRRLRLGFTRKIPATTPTVIVILASLRQTGFRWSPKWRHGITKCGTISTSNNTANTATSHHYKALLLLPEHGYSKVTREGRAEVLRGFPMRRLQLQRVLLVLPLRVGSIFLQMAIAVQVLNAQISTGMIV